MLRTILVTMLCAAAALAADPADHARIVEQQRQATHVQAWQRYPLLGIPKVRQAPVIDGVVDQREWAAAATVGYAIDMVQGLAVNDGVTWQLCYTDTHLYVAFQIDRPDSARAPGPADFAELLLDIDHGHRKYHNIAFNLEKELWSGIGPNVDKSAWNPTHEYKARLTAGGWEGEWAIAFSEFAGYQAAPQPGTIWGVDLVRNEKSPSNRLAHWAFRGQWHAIKDLAHIVFTGQPLAVRTSAIGWMPQHQKMGLKLLVSNFGDQPISLRCSSELRRAQQDLTMQFLPGLDSAFTENLSAAIGARMEDEIALALQPFKVLREASESVEVPANSSRQIELTLGDEPGNYLASFRIDQGDALLAAMATPFVVSVPLDVTLNSYLYSAGVLGYSVDLRRVQGQIDAQTALDLTVRLGKGGAVVASATHEALSNLQRVEGEFSFAPQSAATYYVTAALRRGEQQVAANDVPLILPDKPDWIGSAVGRSKFVPRPWHDLVADVKQAKTLTIDYTWPGDAIFPRVKVKGNEIFTQPMALTFKDASGVEAPVKLSRFTLERSDIESATYQFEGSVGALGRLSGNATVWFDGFMWYHVTLTPTGSADLGGCVFTAKLKPEYARIFTRGRVDGSNGYVAAQGDDAGRVPPQGLTLPYTFQTWVGYVEGGLQWYAENPRNWHNQDPKAAIRVEPQTDGTTLEVRYVDKPVHLQQPIDWQFGLMPTPAKTYTGAYENHAYFQIGGIPSLDAPDPALQQSNPSAYREAAQRHSELTSGLQQRGVKTVILFATGTELFGYPGVFDAQKQQDLHRFVEHMHRQGIKVLHYNGWGISIDAPEWQQFSSELVNVPLKNSGYRTFWGSPASLYNDLFVYRLAEHMKRFNLDGIYMDSTLGMELSQHPNGMRWTDDKGRVRGSYPVRAMRDFALRIYKVLNGEVVQDGVFYSHHSPPANVCVENFVNVRCPSEYAQFHDGPLDEAFVDFFLAKNGGIQYGYHTELTNKNWMRTIKKSLNELNAIGVPLNVSFKSITLAPYIGMGYERMDQPQSALWSAFAWLDSAKARHYPWWSNQRFMRLSPSDGTLSALWLRPGEKALICLSNLPDSGRDLAVTLDLSAMGFGGAVQLQDAVTGEAIELAGNQFNLSVQPQRWRLVKLWRP